MWFCVGWWNAQWFESNTSFKLLYSALFGHWWSLWSPMKTHFQALWGFCSNSTSLLLCHCALACEENTAVSLQAFPTQYQLGPSDWLKCSGHRPPRTLFNTAQEKRPMPTSEMATLMAMETSMLRTVESLLRMFSTTVLVMAATSRPASSASWRHDRRSSWPLMPATAVKAVLKTTTQSLGEVA